MGARGSAVGALAKTGDASRAAGAVAVGGEGCCCCCEVKIRSIDSDGTRGTSRAAGGGGGGGTMAWPSDGCLGGVFHRAAEIALSGVVVLLTCCTRGLVGVERSAARTVV